MTLSRATRSRLQLLGVPKPVSIQITNKIEFWVKRNGMEWTVSRLKDVKMFILHDAAGTVYKPVTWWRGGVLSGPFRFFLYFARKDLGKSLNAIAVYTQFIAVEPTQTQLRKFITSVKAEPYLMDRFPRGFRPLLLGLNKFSNHFPLPISQYPLKNKGTTVEAGIGIREDRLTITRLEESLLYTRPIRKLWEDKRNPVLGSLCSVLETAFYNKDPTRSSDIIGRVHYIQEAGYKLRAIAIPHVILQKALTPLGDYLFDLLKDFPWDCTFDQSAGVQWAQQKLSAGHLLHSIDLSDATNHWPYVFQEELLVCVGVSSEYLQVFDLAVHGLYRLPSGETIQWRKGQPLGLYPSFALFAASHGCFLRSLEAELGLKDSFRVLGDDVVISDQRLAKTYRKWLSILDVPVSESKSFCSRNIAEFAGKIILRDKVITIQKWRDITPVNVIDFLEIFGPKGFKLIPRKWRDPVSRITAVPEPWGLGWNPKGLPFDQRVSPDLCALLLQNKTEYVSNTPNWADSELTALNLEREMEIHALTGGIVSQSVSQASAREVVQTPLFEQEAFLRENIPEAGVTRQELLGLGKPKPIPGQRAGDPRKSGKVSFWETFRRWFGH